MNRHQKDPVRSSAPALLLCALALTGALSGCGSLVGTRRLPSHQAYRSLTSNAVSTSTISEATQVVLRRHNLTEEFDKAPASALAKFHGKLQSMGASNDDLFALTELSFFHAENTGDRTYYLAAAVYAFALLFPEEPHRPPMALDSRYRWACDMYDRGITEGFREVGGHNMDPRPGGYGLPWGTLDVAFDAADLQWGQHRLKDFAPVTELEVFGMRNRYRQDGLGSALAAGIEAGDLTAPGSDLIGPYVKVPATAVLLFDRPRQQLRSNTLHATLRVLAATDVETIQIGERIVPLEIDRTAPIAKSLAANRMLENEIAVFLARAVGASAETVLGARQPYRRGRIPVVFVHGTTSSPARWADMVNDLEADDWVRQRFQFWFFKYDSGNPIAYSAMFLRRQLREAIKRFDPDGTDECLKRMVVIGHSQGGLLTKMTAIHSGDRFWRNLSDSPFDDLKVSPETRALLQEGLFIEPLPFVRRVIFVATPQRGSYLAGPDIVRRLAQNLITLPSTLLQTSTDLLSNESLRGHLKMQSLPTAIDNMAPSHPFIRVISEIPLAPEVTANSIIGVNPIADGDDGGDGVVKYRSAHIAGVESELVVDSPHSMQSHPEVVNEVQRILRLHADENRCDL